jgi:hypothetical protein
VADLLLVLVCGAFAVAYAFVGFRSALRAREQRRLLKRLRGS